MLNIAALEQIHKECQRLGEKKNNDYTSRIDPISVTKLPGISTRLLDKVSRLDSLTHGTEQQVKDESIRDTLMDIINYASYGIMLIDRTWGKKNAV
jgi:hypothetical protein